MSSELLSIGTEDPVYYAELLEEIPSLVDRRLPSDERSSAFRASMTCSPALSRTHPGLRPLLIDRPVTNVFVLHPDVLVP